MITSEDPHSQIENDKRPGTEYPNRHDLEDTKNKQNSCNSKNISDNEITADINSLDLKEKEVFRVVRAWANGYVKHNGHNVEPLHIFFSRSGGTGKSHLLKMIYKAISQTLLYCCKNSEKLRLFLLGSTGISAINIYGTTVHSSPGSKLGTKLLGLN